MRRVLVVSGILGLFVIGALYACSLGSQKTERVVVASNQLVPGMLLQPVTIRTDFTIKTEPSSKVPSSAYIYTSQAALDTFLNNKVITVEFQPGDVVLTNNTQFTQAK